jgi:NADPH2:quinone reductase
VAPTLSADRGYHGTATFVSAEVIVIGSAIGQLLARQGAARVIGGVRSPAPAATLAAAYTPVTQGEGFVARAVQTAGVPGFDVVLESVGGSVLASVFGGLAVGGRVVSYGAAAGEPDPAPPPVPDLRTQNLTITGFSILNRARKASPKALSLIQGVLVLTQDGLHFPAPAVVDWAEAIDAHIAQSEGRSRGKTVVRL